MALQQCVLCVDNYYTEKVRSNFQFVSELYWCYLNRERIFYGCNNKMAVTLRPKIWFQYLAQRVPKCAILHWLTPLCRVPEQHHSVTALADGYHPETFLNKTEVEQCNVKLTTLLDHVAVPSGLERYKVKPTSKFKLLPPWGEWKMTN